MPRAKKIGASKTTLRLYDRLQDLSTRLGKGDKTAGIEALLAHAEESEKEGVCPICKLPFSQCEYFQQLEED